MTACGLQQPADRAVVRDWVWHRPDRPELEPAVIGSDESAPEVVGVLRRILHRVETVGGVLPHVDEGPRQRMAGQVGYAAAHKQGLAVVGIFENGVPEFAQRRAGYVEGTQHGALRRILGGAERDTLDQARDTERVG